MTTQVTLTIDDQPVTVPAGTTVWEAARQQGIDIPVLCHSPQLDPVGVCRMCVVDAGERVLTASCVRECEEGMTVATSSDKVNQHRQMLTRLLLHEHPTPCERETTTKDCELERLGRDYGLLPTGSSGQAVHGPQWREAQRPFFASDRSRPCSLHPVRSLYSSLRRRAIQRSDWPQRKGGWNSNRV